MQDVRRSSEGESEYQSTFTSMKTVLTSSDMDVRYGLSRGLCRKKRESSQTWFYEKKNAENLLVTQGHQ